MFDWNGLLETGRKVADIDVALASGAELCGAARALEAMRCCIDAVEGDVLAELESRGTTDLEFGLRTKTWLAREAGISTSSAAQRVEVGTALRAGLGESRRRLVDGEVSWDHARVMTEAIANPRVSTQITEIETELLDRADATVFERWRQNVRATVELLDQDGPFDPDSALARNRLDVTAFAEGAETHVRGMLVGDGAEITRQTIDVVADELFHRFKADNETCPDLAVPTRRTLRALALVEICRRAGSVELATSRPPKPEVSLVVSATDPCEASTPEGVPLADGTTRVLLCDPSVHAIVVDSLGAPLDMGREIRTANRAQRRAMAVRDGGCGFPGCPSPIGWTDAHHVDWWDRDLGRTDVKAMISLCRHHHRVVHRTGWQIGIAAGGWFYFTSPAGHCFWSQRHGRQPTDRAPPQPQRTAA